MNRILNLILVVGASMALFACSSDEDSSGKGSNEQCAANSECASGICAVVQGGDRCAPASAACTPACPSSQACVDIGGGMGACYPTNDGTQTDGQGGSDIATDTSTDTSPGMSSTTDTNTNTNTNTDTGGNSNLEPGAQECSAFFDCLGDCEQGDAACQQSCQQGATPEALNRYNAIFACIDAEGCRGLDGSVDQECLQSDCLTEIEACFGPQAAPTGEGSCGDFIQCINACPEGDDGTCRDGCVNNTSPEGYETFSEIISCGQDNMCFDDEGYSVPGCLDENCSAEWEACVGPAPEPMGTGTCEDLFACASACPRNDSACTNGCIESLSQQGYDDYNALQMCIEQNNCRDLEGAAADMCLSSNCAAEMEPCFPEGAMSGGAGGAGGA